MFDPEPKGQLADTEVECTGDKRPKWHVLWARSHCEQLVYDQLVVMGFQVFLPKLHVWSRRGGIRHVIIVVAANKTPRRLLAEALDVMEPNKVIGLVFNGGERPLSRYYGYYYYGRGGSRGGRTRLWSRLGKSIGGDRV